MAKKNWNRITPNGITHALQLCKEHAIEKLNLSVANLADRVTSKPDTLYKWLGLGTMPVKNLIAFEQACQKPFVTEYSAHSQGYLLVPVPSGKRPAHKDIIELQAFMVEVSGLMMMSTNGEADAAEVESMIKKLMTDLAYHKNNVVEAANPQMTLVSSHE